MAGLTTFLKRLRGSLFTTRFETEMEAEMQHHLALEIDELIRRGMPPQEARAAAQRTFGSVAHVKDDCRESWGLRRSTRSGRICVRRPQSHEVPLLHRDHPAHARARHRRQHGHLQRRPRRAAQFPALHERRSTRRSEAAADEARAGQRRPVRQGDGRLPITDPIARSARRVSPDGIQSARQGRRVARQDGRGVAEFLRRARRHADQRPHLPRG